MSFFSKLFGGDPETQARKAAEKAARLEAEAKEKAREVEVLLKRATGGDPEALSYAARSKAAISLVLGQHTDAGIQAWGAIAEDFPDVRGTALQQVGACYHMQKAYPDAFSAYEAAIAAGYPEGDIADSIAEIKKAMAKG